MKKVLTLLVCCCLVLVSTAQKNKTAEADSIAAANAKAGIVSKKAKQGNYAIFYIYRPKSRKISFASFTININDSAVCKIHSNKRYTVKVYQPGAAVIWARSESKSTLTMTIEPGKAYYLKCKVKKGFAGEIPDLVLMDPAVGAEEFDEAEDGD